MSSDKNPLGPFSVHSIKDLSQNRSYRGTYKDS